MRGIESDYANARSGLGGRGQGAIRIEQRARHVAHKYLRMLLIIAQRRTCCSRRRRRGKSGAGTRQAVGTGNFDQGNLRFLFNFKSGKIYITLVACTSIPPYPPLLPGVFMSCGAGHLSHVDAAMLPVRGKLKVGFNFSIRPRTGS